MADGTPEMVERVARAFFEYGRTESNGLPAWKDESMPKLKDQYRAAARAAIAAMREPNTAMMRALLKDRGYDPDAKEDTLDGLGQLDVMTMGEHLRTYRLMIDEALR